MIYGYAYYSIPHLDSFSQEQLLSKAGASIICTETLTSDKTSVLTYLYLALLLLTRKWQ